MKLCVFGITYGDKATEYVDHRNTATDKLHRFEYNPMVEIIENRIGHLSENDLLGIFSWKFRQKTGVSGSHLMQLLNRSAAPGIDVYNLSPDLGNNIAGMGCFMDWCAHKLGHGEELRSLIKECCNYVGITYVNNPPVVIYANQFIATKWIYYHYMQTVVKPCLELLEGELWHRANVPAGYQVGLDLPLLKQNTGLDFYNYVPFVLERMFMQYVHHYKLKTVSLI